MEFRNLHQVQHPELQDHQLVGVVSSNPSPCFSAGNYEHATAWRSPLFLLNNDGNIHASNCNEAAPNPMVQELSFINWPNPAITPSDSHLIYNKIKQESSTMLSDMLNPSTSPSEMLQLKTLSPTNYKNHMINNNGELQPSAFQPSMQIDPNNYDHHDNLPSLGGNKGMTSFSQIFPSVNISNLRNNNNDSMSSFSSSSSTMEMNNFQGDSDLLGGGSLSQPTPSSHLIELIKGSSPFGNIDHDHLQQSSDLKLWNGTNNFSFYNNNGVPESKRSPTCIVESNYHLTAPKMPRLESRSSCPPLKVRKEKLGDRIAALQQLVAPFGKTDTASVLMEAIGYIKFLQNQIETLSVPYMKLSSCNKITNNSHTVSDEHCGNREPKPDLRSNELCLVPVSCMSYLASDAGIGSVWPPSSYNPSF